MRSPVKLARVAGLIVLALVFIILSHQGQKLLQQKRQQSTVRGSLLPLPATTDRFMGTTRPSTPQSKIKGSFTAETKKQPRPTEEAKRQQLSNNSIIQPLPAQLKEVYQQPTKLCPEIHFICTFPLLTDKDIKKMRATPQKIVDRMSELVTSLQRNLNHPCIHRVYFLYNKTDVVEYVKDHVEQNQEKLSFNKVSDPRNHGLMFDFAFKNLQDKIVIYTNADVYLGEGFEKLDKKKLREKKLMYVLTRHGAKEKKCDMSKHRTTRTCDDGRYIGSHDTYLFVPNGTLPVEIKSNLTFTVGSWGAENVSMWAFRTLGNFTVTNPCKVLKTYHLHCTELREVGRLRVNTKKKGGHARPTNVL